MSAPMIAPHKSKGRPRVFDRREALHKALEMFWQRGYQPASIADLCAAMGINPPSLYAAFGSKAQLFMEAVNHYETTYWDATWAGMRDHPDFHVAMQVFFRDAAHILSSQDAPCGCLVILATTNVSSDSEGVDAALRSLRAEGRELLIDRVRRAIRENQISPDTDAHGLALTLNTVLEGMSLAVRDGATRSDLLSIAEHTLRTLPARPAH